MYLKLRLDHKVTQFFVVYTNSINYMLISLGIMVFFSYIFLDIPQISMVSFCS